MLFKILHGIRDANFLTQPLEKYIDKIDMMDKLANEREFSDTDLIMIYLGK